MLCCKVIVNTVLCTLVGLTNRRSRHTVVCRAAQEAGMPPVRILTGRKRNFHTYVAL